MNIITCLTYKYHVYSKTLWIQLQNLMDPTPRPYRSATPPRPPSPLRTIRIIWKVSYIIRGLPRWQMPPVICAVLFDLKKYCWFPIDILYILILKYIFNFQKQILIIFKTKKYVCEWLNVWIWTLCACVLMQPF